MSNEALDAIGLVLAVCALALAYLRWLRVAQREHYVPGYTVRFARRWWGSGTVNKLLGLIGAAGAVVSVWWVPAIFAALRGAASTAVFAALGAPVLVDLALWATRAREARHLAPFVTKASQRLRSV